MRTIRFAAGLVLALVLVVGPAEPSHAATTGGGYLLGRQFYPTGIPLAPSLVPTSFFFSGSVVAVHNNVPTSLETLTCNWAGGGTESQAAAVLGSVNGPCNSASLTLFCTINYNRVGLWMALEGTCASATTPTLRFAAVMEWIGLVGAPTADVGGYFVLGAP